MNLARGFTYAGAENLVFSLWKINDLSTSQIIASFYDNLSKTKSAFITNNYSKLEYLNNDEISNIKKSPYYWSAFMYYGDLTPKTTKYSKYIVYFIVTFSLVLLIWLLIFKRKNEQPT